MTEQTLHEWAQHLSQQKGFVLGEQIYQGEYYSKDKIRNIILAATWQDKPAVLKIYNDPRLNDEARSLEQFHRHNRSTLLTAPVLYEYEIVSPHKGWLIMERLPESGSFFQSPMSAADRKEFLQIYLEYRQAFPTTPWRPLVLVESLPADKRYLFSINRWLELANNKEAGRQLRGEEVLLTAEKFIPRFNKAIKLIVDEYAARPSLWCHGHFKPKEVYRVPNGKTYLTDFAHTTMCPEGYEFGFMVWADWFMGADWQLSYPEWKQGIDAWIQGFTPIAEQLKIDRFDSLAKAALIERILGAVLADVTASDKPLEEQKRRLALLFQLLDEMV